MYSLHESDVYCVGKGKDHKQYEYGRKASVVSTKNSNVIVGVASHDDHEHDSKTLKAALESAHEHRDKPIKLAVVDRGYRGAKKHIPDEVNILLPSPPLKRDTAYQRQKKRILCRRRAAIEPIIGHLKHDYRLSRNWLRGRQRRRNQSLYGGLCLELEKVDGGFLLVRKHSSIGCDCGLNIHTIIRTVPRTQHHCVLYALKRA